MICVVSRNRNGGQRWPRPRHGDGSGRGRANLAIAARDRAKTAETAAELRQAYGVEVLEIQVDVCDEDS